MLYNGLPEARAILSQEVDNVEGAGVRRHALDYLKGRKVERMGMWTYDIMQPDEEEPGQGDEDDQRYPAFHAWAPSADGTTGGMTAGCSPFCKAIR